jgi:hypothetical protein
MTSAGRTRWLGEHRVNGVPAVRIGRRGDELVAEFINAGTLVAGAKGISLEPKKGADPQKLDKLRASAVDALLRHLQGKLAFHAGAAGLGDSSVMFVGPTGSGKSTLAAALCADRGMHLVADDTASVEVSDEASMETRVEILPTQTSVWLLQGARLALGLQSNLPGKVAVALPAAPSRGLRLAGVLGLLFDPKALVPTIRRIHGQDAFSLLSTSLIRFVIDDPKAQLREFEQLSCLVQHCPVFELRRCRNLGQLRRSVDVVHELVTSAAVMTGV